ncbi:MAG: TIGR03915 family putative DNA repair protein [Brachymonas sp.]|nr:TIGR03915 family putative DNA repair protein [Brachymonas sp.]
MLRAQHLMKGFVRFRKIEDNEGEVLRIAWYEPEHYIVEAVAPFFVDRFASMRWSILTPLGCAHWLPACDVLPQGRLHFGPPADVSQKPPPDGGEMLWLTYYTSTFNPARLKRQTMQKFMPRKFWRNLPEAQLIEPLCQQATERAGKMLWRNAPSAPE